MIGHRMVDLKLFFVSTRVLFKVEIVFVKCVHRYKITHLFCFLFILEFDSQPTTIKGMLDNLDIEYILHLHLHDCITKQIVT